MNKISVIIPVFNQSEYLEDAIESVFNQTIPAHEIIVVNDGSTDNSLEIAERYMFKGLPMIESPVRVINQTNKGLPSARNTGIMNATGDYILPLDADDTLMENALEVISQKIIETQFDIIAPSFREFGESNREVVLQQFSNIADMFAGNRLGYFSAIKRSVLLEVGGYNPKMIWGWEDYDLWFDIFKRGKSLMVLPDILVNYRVKKNSMIHTANAHANELSIQMRANHPNIQWPN